MEKLKPCPFCGKKAKAHLAEKYRFVNNLKEWRVYCENEFCGCNLFHGHDTKEEAVEAWNRRIE